MKDFHKKLVGKEAFKEAEELATKAGLQLRDMSSELGEESLVQYRLCGDNWFKDIYPLTQRICCPEKARQGPFVSMHSKKWTVLDVVKQTLKVMDKLRETTNVVKNGYPGHNRNTIEGLVKATAAVEGIDLDSGFRDVLTDVMHVADHLNVNFDNALESAREIHEEEKDDEDFTYNEED